MTKPKQGAKRGRPFSAAGQMPSLSVRIPQAQYDALRAMPGSLSGNLQAVIAAGLLAGNAQKQGTSEQSGKKTRIRPNSG